jgi:hypothetical protein
MKKNNNKVLINPKFTIEEKLEEKQHALLRSALEQSLPEVAGGALLSDLEWIAYAFGALIAERNDLRAQLQEAQSGKTRFVEIAGQLVRTLDDATRQETSEQDVAPSKPNIS